MSFLSDIVASRRKAVASLDVGSINAEIADAPAPRDFRAALASDGMSIIAEIKRRSPSKGALRPDLDPAAFARAYERGGARVVSVLTEPEFFGGSPDDLVAVRAATSVPVLWKDFVLDPVQLALARAQTADGVLLIVRILGDELASFIAAARSLGLCPLVEVFDEDDVERALDADADVVGVNHRDLETFEEDPSATARLRKLVPDDVVLVAESAIRTRSDIEALEDIGVHAALVGEAIVTSRDPEAKMRELLGQ